jgi:hypothetical protein
LKTSSFALAGSIPTQFGKFINLTDLSLEENELSGTPPFAHVAWFGNTSLPLALTTSSSALAGSIPTEFGKLTDVGTLRLSVNELTGTPRLLMLRGVVARV